MADASGGESADGHLAGSVSTRLLPIGIVVYALLFLGFYPTFYASQDERIYLAKAFSLSQGELFHSAPPPGEMWIDKYPPGQALLLTAAMQIGDWAIALVNPLALVLATLILAAILRKRAVPEYFALLLLFHPAMFLFARTIMADVTSAFAFLLAFWLLLEERRAWLWGALALGFTVSLRVAMLLFAVFGLVWVIWREREATVLWKIGLGFALGAAPFLYYLRQSQLMSGYAHDVDSISAANIAPHAALYFASLNIIFPAMFLIGMIQRYRGELFPKLTAALALMFFPMFTRHPGEGLELVVLVQRYFLFVIGPLLIGYSLFLKERVLVDTRRFLALGALLLAAGVALSAAHQDVLNRNAAFHKTIYEHTTSGSLLITDDRTVELIQDAAGRRLALNTELMKTVEDVARRIDAAGSRDVFLIYMRREPGEQWPLGDAILERYEWTSVVNRTDKWDLQLFHLAR